MNRALFAVVVAICVLSTACGNADKERAKLSEVQRQADERIAEVENSAKQKIAAAERRVDELQTELAEAGAQAKAAAEDQIASAKGEADKFASQAAAALGKARAAYKESEKKQLTALVKDADELRAKATKAAANKSKPQIDAALKDVVAKRDAVRKEVETFDDATVENLKAVKAKVDKAMSELKQAVQALRSKVP